MKNLKQLLVLVSKSKSFLLLLGFCICSAADAAAAAENKKKAPTSKILPLLHEQDPELVFNMLHVQHQHASLSFEKHNSISSAQAQSQRRLGKSSPKLKREREPKSDKNKNKKSELSLLEVVTTRHDTCKAELAALKYKNSLPEYMYVQQADKCHLRREDDGQIVLESAHFLSDTEQFSDRPMRYEYTIETSDWFEYGFNDKFEDSIDGWPNTAMSIVDDDESRGTVVSVYSFAYSRVNQTDGNTVYGYKLEQSADQANIMSLEYLLGDTNEVIFDHCAMFIDSDPGSNQATTPCDNDTNSPNSCAEYYTKQTALSVRPSTCPAGMKEEIVPPSWWSKCQSQTGACPSGCGTCKPPDDQSGGGCFCAGNSGLCTVECGYPGQKDDKACSNVPCREDDPEAAGCVPLDDNCGGSASTDCMDSQGTITKGDCGFTGSSLNPGQACIAFCSQVPGTNKCKTTRMQSYVTPSTKNPCPENSLTAKTSEGFSNECSNVGGIVLLDGDFNRCKNPTVCPYDSAGLSSECSYADGSSVQIEQNLQDEGVTVPNISCPGTKNKGSEGFPSFFTDPRVPSDADVVCQNACACNTNTGFGPPNCFQSGQPYPGPIHCCYCDGKNIAYDKNSFDSCGNYLPIYGEGVLPDQYTCYNDYATKNGLDNAFPESKKYHCVSI